MEVSQADNLSKRYTLFFRHGGSPRHDVRIGMGALGYVLWTDVMSLAKLLYALVFDGGLGRRLPLWGQAARIVGYFSH